MIPQFNDLIFLLTGRIEVWLPQEINTLLICLLVFLLAFFCPQRFFKLRRLSYLRPLENALNRLANKRAVAIAVIGILAFATNAAISLIGQMPAPASADEFSYLLAADTYTNWRWSNPTHPLWMHFESLHIIQQPSYVSKYPPGQGLMLAAGQILTGLPIAGSWMGTAFACMAICWALQQWLTPRTAFLGGLLAICHPVVLYWTQSYWGCQMSVLGGALVVGALRFFDADNPRVLPRAGWILGIGCALMLITRPFEGASLTVSSLLFIAWQWWRNREAAKEGTNAISLNALSSRWPAVAAIGAMLCITIAFWGYYNYRTTGQISKMPYAVHHQLYDVSPLVIWGKFKPHPVYRHRELKIMHTQQEAPPYMLQRTPRTLFAVTVEKIGRLLSLHCQSLALAAGVLLLPVVYRRDRRLRPLFWIMGAFVLTLLVEVWLLPHYTTAIVATAFLLALQGWRRLRVWRWHNRPCGLFLARATVVLSFLSVLTSIAQLTRPDDQGLLYDAPGMRTFSRKQIEITKQLGRTPGKDLVIVHYSLDHPVTQEWVYNAADIDAAEVVWARTMTPARDGELLRYFSSRNIWRLDVDENPPRLQLSRKAW